METFDGLCVQVSKAHCALAVIVGEMGWDLDGLEIQWGLSHLKKRPESLLLPEIHDPAYFGIGMTLVPIHPSPLPT